MNNKEKNLVAIAKQYLQNSVKQDCKNSIPFGFKSEEDLLEAIESEARASGHLLSEDEVTSIQFDRLIYTLDVLING